MIECNRECVEPGNVCVDVCRCLRSGAVVVEVVMFHYFK